MSNVLLPILLVFAIYFLHVSSIATKEETATQCAGWANHRTRATTLTECPACKSAVSAEAAKCPSCGHPFQMSPRKTQRTLALVAGLLLLAIGIWLVRQPRYGYPWAPHDDTLPTALSGIVLGLALLGDSYYSYFRDRA